MSGLVEDKWTLMSAPAFSLLQYVVFYFPANHFTWNIFSTLYGVKCTKTRTSQLGAAAAWVPAKASAILTLIVFVWLVHMLTKWNNQTVLLWKYLLCRALRVSPGAALWEPQCRERLGWSYSQPGVRKAPQEAEALTPKEWARAGGFSEKEEHRPQLTTNAASTRNPENRILQQGRRERSPPQGQIN